MKNTLLEGKTYYDILEISFGANSQEIHSAYEKAKIAYSPSSPALYAIFTEQETKEINELVETAYSVLSNPSRREEYDKTLNLNNESAKTLNKIVSDEKQKPSGTKEKGQSQFGNYVVDDQFEAKIAATTEFDGTFLQKVRHYKNVTLENLSDKSKISKTYILAIESHDFDSLPTRVFVRGFVVQIAKLLDLDAEKVAKSYMKNYSEK